MPRCKNTVCFIKKGDEYADIFCKGGSDGGNNSCLYHRKNGPAVNKAGKFSKSAFQVNKLSARFGHHRGKFAIAKRGEQGNDSAKKPAKEHQQRGSEHP